MLTLQPRTSRDLYALVVEVLPIIDDDRVAGLVEDLAFAVIEREERLEAVRAVQSVALEQLHHAQQEITRLRERLAEIRPKRGSRVPAATYWQFCSGRDVSSDPNTKTSTSTYGKHQPKYKHQH